MRRRREIGGWHHQTLSLGAGALAANTVTNTVIVLTNTQPSLIQAFSADIAALDPTNSVFFIWGLLIQRAGGVLPTDPTVADTASNEFWCYGMEPVTPNHPADIHCDPKTKRRLSQGERLVFFAKNLGATSVGYSAQVRTDFHQRLL
jgi:hypothetical protein